MNIKNSVTNIKNSVAALIKRGLSSFQIIILGFAGVVLLGALLLMLPISSKESVVTPFGDTLFTATSAVCVTGLVVRDTATHWSIFGQTIILLLIQIGGLGVITMAASLMLLSGRKISLMQRSTMQEAIAAPEVGGIVRLTLLILKWTAIFELCGALCLTPIFCRDHGPKGIWLALFHSISAFCNAGFDILGTPDAKFASLTSYSADVGLNVILMSLIIIGGIGFLTWEDIGAKKLKFKRYRLQTKVILATTVLLIIIPAVYFYLRDFAGMPMKERVLCSLFQSVTTRTAGFNTADLGAMTENSNALMMLLMMTGGAPGSTAGGMKVTTFAVLLINMISVFSRKESAEVFGRRIDNGVVKNAATILVMYLTLFFGGALIISTAEKLPLHLCMFETASAVGTAGLTLGITPQLGVLSRIVLIILMFLGRVGGLTLIFAAFSRPNIKAYKLPKEKITVG